MRFTQMFFHKYMREGFEYIDITDLFTLQTNQQQKTKQNKKTRNGSPLSWWRESWYCHIFIIQGFDIFYYSLRDTLLKYNKNPCYDISSITAHNATDVTDLIKQLPATIGNTKATDVWLCMYTIYTEEKPH